MSARRPKHAGRMATSRRSIAYRPSSTCELLIALPSRGLSSRVCSRDRMMFTMLVSMLLEAFDHMFPPSMLSCGGEMQ